MQPQRWREVEDLYHAALDCEPAARAALLEAAEPELRKGGAFQTLTNIPPGWFFNTEALSQVRLSLAPDGKSLATTLVRHTGDIWTLDGFQEPPNLWQRLWRK
jgi:hypothetical protein